MNMCEYNDKCSCLRKTPPSQKGKIRSQETKKKLSLSHIGKKWSKKQRESIPQSLPSGEAHHAWKDDEATPCSIHHWLYNHFGKANHCDLCNKTEAEMTPTKDGRPNFDWSSRTHQYTRNLQEWWQLCKPCHRKYDNLMKKEYAT